MIEVATKVPSALYPTTVDTSIAESVFERAPNLLDASLKIALEDVSITPVNPDATNPVEAVIVLPLIAPATVTVLPLSVINDATNLALLSTF
jgi:hypothetical protein